ncbi:MAG: MerR family transcriptional regulator [Oscillospiraceae bacterium]|nr:MerR family transcriptional regulator [Oscillospiraceae bacterium]MCL2278253.1 MerR family transcriptional regulator [Oscillospiraceae bacterium]
MNILSCKYCRKPFASLGGRICPDCLEQIDRDFITVRDYIYEHKQTNIDTVAEETEVPKAIILHLLKEGRLILDGPSGEGSLFCERCKKPINTGRLCKSCAEKAASLLEQSVSGRKPGEDEANLKSSAKLGHK